MNAPNRRNWLLILLLLILVPLAIIGAIALYIVVKFAYINSGTQG